MAPRRTNRAENDDGERPGPSRNCRIRSGATRCNATGNKRRRVSPTSCQRAPKRGRGRPKKRRGQPRPNAGRKVKHGADIHERTVRKKAQKLRDEVAGEGDFLSMRKAFLQLVDVRFGSDAKACVELLTDGKEHSFNVSQIRKLLEEKTHLPQPLPNEDCVAVQIGLDQTKHQYKHISETVNDAARIRLMKCYNTVSKYKKECRPSIDIVATETKAEIELGHLLDHTVRRTVLAYNEVIEMQLGRPRRRTTRATFTVAWGFDAASAQRQYQNAFADEANAGKKLNSLFAAALNPIELETDAGKLLWSNTNPQSASVVRPILLEFEKELKPYVKG